MKQTDGGPAKQVLHTKSAAPAPSPPKPTILRATTPPNPVPAPHMSLQVPTRPPPAIPSAAVSSSSSPSAASNSNQISRLTGSTLKAVMNRTLLGTKHQPKAKSQAPANNLQSAPVSKAQKSARPSRPAPSVPETQNVPASSTSVSPNSIREHAQSITSSVSCCDHFALMCFFHTCLSTLVTMVVV